MFSERVVSSINQFVNWLVALGCQNGFYFNDGWFFDSINCRWFGFATCAEFIVANGQFAICFWRLIYCVPDSIPLVTADDAAATTIGALLSYGIALRKQPNTPKWIIIPLVTAGIYTFFGGVIPGPIDEVFVDVVALVIAWISAREGSKRMLEDEDSILEVDE